MRKTTTFSIALTFFLAMIGFSSQGQTLLDEDFSSYTGNAPDPVGWNEFTGTETLTDADSEWNSNESVIHSDSVSAVASFSSWNSNMIDAWLVTPNLDLTQNGGNNRLSFYYKGKDENLGEKDSVSVMISLDGGTTYEWVKTYQFNLPTQWTQEIIDLSGYNQPSVKIAFYFHDDTDADNYTKFYLEDVKVGSVPASDFGTVPHVLDARSMKDTTVFCGDAVNFNMVVKNYGSTTGQAPVTWMVDGGTPTDHSESSSSLAYLEGENYEFTNTWTAPATQGEYNLKIFTDLAGDTNHDNDTATVSLTVYQPHTSLDENFEASTDWPLGWEAFPEGNTNLSVKDDSYNAYSDPNCVKFNSNAEKGFMLLTPAVDVASGDSYRLTSYIRGSTGGEIIIGNVTELNDTTTFTPKDTVVIEENYTYYPYEVIFDTPGIQQLAYKYNKTGEYVYLDNISFEKVAPYEVGLKKLNKDAVIVEGGTSTYKIKVRNRGYNNETFDLSVDGNWTYTIYDKTGQSEISTVSLEADEVDTVLVQVEVPADVSEPVSDTMEFAAVSQQESNASASITNETYAYPPYATIDEGFEDSEAVPFAWTALDPEGENVTVYSSSYNANTGSNYVQLSNAETGTLVGIATPALENADLYRMKFNHSEGGTLIVGNTTNIENLSSMDTIGTYTGGFSYDEIEVTFSPESEKSYVVFIHQVNGGYDNVYLDDISIEKVPPYAVDITGNAEGTFVPAGMKASYFVSLENRGSEEETFDLTAKGNWEYTVLNKEQTEEISSVTLPSETEDSVYVQVQVPEKDIADGDTDLMEFIVTAQNDAEATDTAKITTEAYNPVLTLDEGFDASSQLPDYWTGLKFHSYSSAEVTTYGGYNSSNAAKIYETSSAGGAHSYLVTPLVSKEMKRYQLSFYSQNYTPGNNMMVGIMTDPSDISTFELIDTIFVSDTYTKDSVEMVLSENAFIAFATTNSGNTVKIDNIQLSKLPAVSILPESNSTQINVDTSVTFRFNTAVRNLDDSELTDDNIDSFITLKEGGANGDNVAFDAVINAEKTEITATPSTNLKSETPYYVAFADSVVEDTNDVAVPAAEATFTTKDVLAPEFGDGYPLISDTTQTSFTFKIQLNEKGSVGYIVVPEGSAEPTTEQVLNGENYGEVSLISNGLMNVDLPNTEYNQEISGLELSTAYDLYLAARDDASEPNVQESVTLLNVTTLADQTAPEFIADYPSVSEITENSFKISAQLNEKGTLYYVVVDDGSTEPGSEQVKAGEDYEGVSLVHSGSTPVAEPNTTVSDLIENLDAGSTYNVYVVAEDSAETPNLQETPVSLEVTTNTTTDIENGVNGKLQIYPNPVVNHLNIESGLKIRHVYVYDMLGNVHKQIRDLNQKHYQMNFQSMQTGYYLIKLIHSDGSQTIEKIQKL
mgnify:CR=1 FL=1